MIYFDTAYLAKCYLPDHGHEDVRRLASLHDVACCELGRVETAAAFHRVLREGRITPTMHACICRQFDADNQAEVWSWLPLPSGLLRDTAARFQTIGPAVFLRTNDALHLACAAANGFKDIYSSDRHILEAAHCFGLKGRNIVGPIIHPG